MKKKSSPIAVKIILSGIFFLVLGLVIFVVWRVRLAMDVNRQLAAIHAAGLPTNGDEANDYYTAVPDEENAAVKMTEAFALMANYPDRRSNEVALLKFPQRKETLTPEQLELVAGYCAMNSNALAQVREAIKLPRCRYPMDLSWGASTLLPHLAKLKGISRTAQFQSLLNTNESSLAISTMIGTARTLDKEPVLISKLVRIALLNMAELALERRLNTGSLGEADLKRLSELFAESAKTNQIANGLIGERAMFMQYFRMSYAEINRLSNSGEDNNPTEQSGPPLPGPEPFIFKFTGFFEREQRFYLQSMETFISLAENSPKKLSVITNYQEQIWQPISHNHYIILSMLMPAVGSASVKEANGLAQVRTAQAALAVERFRLANEKLPEKLGELVPQFLSAVPEDPFDGQPLRYRRLEKGYVVYSIGSDAEDNGGRERPVSIKSNDKTHYDITFTVER